MKSVITALCLLMTIPATAFAGRGRGSAKASVRAKVSGSSSYRSGRSARASRPSRASRPARSRTRPSAAGRVRQGVRRGSPRRATPPRNRRGRTGPIRRVRNGRRARLRDGYFYGPGWYGSMWWGGGVYYNARAYPPVGDVYYNDAPQEPAYYAYRPEQPALRLAQPKFSVGIFGSTLMAEDYAGEPQNVGSLGGLYGRFRMTNNGHVWLHTELSEVSYESLGDEDTLTKFGMFAHVDLLPQSSFRLYGFVGGGIQEDFAWADSAGRLFGEAGLGIGYRFHLGPRISIDLTADIRAGKLAEEQNQNVPLSTSGTSYYEPYLPERYEAGRISLGVNF